MELNRDFGEFIASCVAHDVHFMIVGGYAVAVHGHPRFTKDLDVWVWVDEQNANRLVAALDDFGFGSVGLTADDFLEEGMVVQLGYPPKRIDIINRSTASSSTPAGTPHRRRDRQPARPVHLRRGPPRQQEGFRPPPRTWRTPPPSSSYPTGTTIRRPCESRGILPDPDPRQPHPANSTQACYGS
jgi:hypothetical protein